MLIAALVWTEDSSTEDPDFVKEGIDATDSEQGSNTNGDRDDDDVEDDPAEDDELVTSSLSDSSPRDEFLSENISSDRTSDVGTDCTGVGDRTENAGDCTDSVRGGMVLRPSPVIRMSLDTAREVTMCCVEESRASSTERAVFGASSRP